MVVPVVSRAVQCALDQGNQDTVEQVPESVLKLCLSKLNIRDLRVIRAMRVEYVLLQTSEEESLEFMTLRSLKPPPEAFNEGVAHALQSYT